MCGPRKSSLATFCVNWSCSERPAGQYLKDQDPRRLSRSNVEPYKLERNQSSMPTLISQDNLQWVILTPDLEKLKAVAKSIREGHPYLFLADIPVQSQILEVRPVTHLEGKRSGLPTYLPAFFTMVPLQYELGPEDFRVIDSCPPGGSISSKAVRVPFYYIGSCLWGPRTRGYFEFRSSKPSKEQVLSKDGKDLHVIPLVSNQEGLVFV